MRSTNDGEVHVFTFKEGVLSAVAHDLRLTLGRFELVNDAEIVQFSADPASLHVDGVMRGGNVDVGALSRSDRGEIERTIRERVLRVDRFPRLVFSGRLSPASQGFQLDGRLSLCGVDKPLALSVQRGDTGLTGTVELKPSAWGIAPYKAMLGAIKLQDRVVVAFRIPPVDAW